MLPDKAILEFQSIYQKEIGSELSFDEAKLKSENFIELFDLISNNKDENKSKRIPTISSQ